MEHDEYQTPPPLTRGCTARMPLGSYSPYFPTLLYSGNQCGFVRSWAIPGYRFRLFRSLNVVGKFKPKWSQKPFSNVTDSAALESEVSD
jgi:hypothetical protein